MIVETVRLHKVDDVEAVLFASPSVCNLEVVPLSVPTSVVIRLQNQIILIFVNLDCTAQISRLKS